MIARTRVRTLHSCNIPSMSEKSPVLKSLSAVQSHMPDWNFVVETATIVTVIFCFHNSALSCSIPNETINITGSARKNSWGVSYLELPSKKCELECYRPKFCSLFSSAINQIFSDVRLSIGKYSTRLGGLGACPQKNFLKARL